MGLIIGPPLVIGAGGGGLGGNVRYLDPVEAEYIRRVSGGSTSIGSGKAKVKKMLGRTLVWNQLQQNVLFENSGQGYAGAGTKTYDNGECVVTADENGDAAVYYSAGYKQISGHKYLLQVFAKSEIPVVAFYGSLNSVNLTNTYQRFSIFRTADNNNTVYNNCYVYRKSDFIGKKLYIKYYQLFDLTLMFGSGNEPATVEEFEKLFPLPYYEYNAGTLISNKASAIETVGFNQWDEEWEVGQYNAAGQKMTADDRIRSKNLIPILPNTNYYLNIGFTYFYVLFDAERNSLGTIYSKAAGQGFTTPGNALYVVFYTAAAYGTTYKRDLCINLSDPNRNGTYEPYKHADLPLNLSTITGKLNGEGESVTIFPDGMKSAGTVFDELVVDGDGMARKAIKRIGNVDLGTLSWNYNSTKQLFVSNLLDAVAVIQSVKANILCAKYTTNTQVQNEALSVGIALYNPSTKFLTVYDSTYGSDYAAFKTAMSGVLLYYELAEPEEYILDQNLPSSYKVDGNGTEERLPADTASEVIAPVRYQVAYPAPKE